MKMNFSFFIDSFVPFYIVYNSIFFHSLQYEPIVQKGNEGLVHHMILYACPGDDLDPDVHHGMHEDCEHERMEKIREKCYVALFLYGVGTGVKILVSIQNSALLSVKCYHLNFVTYTQRIKKTHCS